MNRIKLDSHVAYSVQWLKSVGMTHTSLSHARGKVVALQPLGSSTLATVEWNDPDIPPRVNVNNLAIVGPNRRFANVD